MRCRPEAPAHEPIYPGKEITVPLRLPEMSETEFLPQVRL